MTTSTIRSVLAAGTTAALLAVGLLVAAPAATAADAGGAASTTTPPPPTVTADVLPTVQINGVVWDQVVVGNKVYVTGEFTRARPAGSAPGVNEVVRNHLLAFDITTGQLDTRWAPSLDARGLAIEASADGRRIFVGGDFGRVNGSSRTRLAAFDAATGAPVTSFAQARGKVGALAVAGDTLYVGGDFATLGDQARTRLGAVSASTGGLLAWAPTADREVMGLVAPAGSGRVVVSGRFDTLNGGDEPGMGALDAASGATLDWAANDTIKNHGPDSAIWSLSTDGTQVYGTGYDYYGPSPFEGSFAAGVDGALRWVAGCMGDTYGSQPVGDVLYTVGHPHNCTTIGGHPQTEPWTFQRAMATTTAVRGTNLDGPFRGAPAPELLHWEPTIGMGTYTKQYQGAWTVTGDSRYVVLGGEFPRVNGVAQQGLVRFATSALAPRKEGPQGYPELKPELVTAAGPGVRASFTASWDRDDATLTYELQRGGNAATAPVVATTTVRSAWWSRPRVALRDPSAPAGTTQTYRVRVRDAAGNSLTSATTTVAVPATTPQGPGPYAQRVLADGATSFWRLGETEGGTAYDWAGGDDLVLGGATTRTTDGSVAGDGATTFPGTDTVPAAGRAVTVAPDTFSVEAWFRTTSTAGGKVVGFGDRTDARSGNYDRHVYLDGAGRVSFGVHPWAVRLQQSAPGYNDGQWHHVVATLGAEGQTLFVDGRRVARDRGTTSGQPYSGVWRVGGDNLGGWPSDGDGNLAGDVDEVAVYGTQLQAATVAAHYAASGRTAGGEPAPTDAYGAAVAADDPDLFWRLDSLSADGTTPDSSASGREVGRVQGDLRVAEPGGVLGSPAAATTDGQQAGLGSTTRFTNPRTYSQELWFSTGTTRGGKLIGFGSEQQGWSGGYDRHVEMLDDGRLRFGTWTGRENTITTERAYNDRRWHHLVASQGADGMKLYLDGALVGTNPETGAQDYAGFWRVGGDSGWGGHSSAYFEGRIDEVAVYSTVLPADRVAAHHAVGKVPFDEPPTAAFTATSDGTAVSVDASTSTDPEGPLTYAWDFGDGATATGATASHTYARPGRYEVALVVTDSGKQTARTTRTVTASAPAPADAYGAAVRADDPVLFWRLDEVADGVTPDSSATGSDPGRVQGDLRVERPGGVRGSSAAATTDGQWAGLGSSTRVQGPRTYSQEVWFSTTTTRGGKIIGFGTDQSGWSGGYDRHVEMLDDGRVRFGTWTGQENTTTSDRSYNDGGWHHLVATQGADGMRLYVDGELVGTNPQTDQQQYDGFWRVGGDSSWGGHQSAYFEGRVDEVAVYAAVLPAERVRAHHDLGRRPVDAVPTASFTARADGLAVAVDAAASTDPEGPVTHAWDFGDGATATGVTASHTYRSGGSYEVALVVTDSEGQRARTTRTVQVLAPAPTDAYGAAVVAAGPDLFWRLDQAADGTTPDATPQGRQPGRVLGGLRTEAPGGVRGSRAAATLDGVEAGVASTTPVDSPSTYSQELWFSTTTTRGGKLIGFGGAQAGGSSNYDRHVELLDDGRVRFGTWTGQENTTTSQASYNDGAWHHLVATQGAEGMRLYVDGTLVGTHDQTGAEPYRGYWRVGGDTGWGGHSSQYVEGRVDEVAVYPTVLTAEQVAEHHRLGLPGVEPVDGPPTAAFTAATTDLQVRVDGTTSSDAEGPVTYAWSFGDGATADTATAQHTYAAAGSYEVTLVVTDTAGHTATAKRSVTVTAPAPVDGPPTAAFTAATTDLQVRVDGTTSSDAEGAVTYAWSFGDGATADTATAQHTYAAAGSYEVTLVVTDTAGHTATAKRSVTVTAPAPVDGPPTAAFTAATTDLQVRVDGTTSSDAEGAVTYAWSFGDGATADTATAQHTYAAAGSYEVTLVVTDTAGHTATAKRSVTVTAPAPVDGPPTAAFTAATTDLQVRVDGTGSSDAEGPVTYAWSFGDGATADTATAQHTYAAAGSYEVTLVVTDTAGHTATAKRSVTVTAPAPVDGPPTAAFTAATTDLQVRVDGTTSSDAEGPVTYAWSFGDGATADTATAQHTYAAAGSYEVTLVVTDTAGHTATTKRSVTVTAPVPVGPTVLGADAFGRTVAGGWGTADRGGAWTTSGTASSFSVQGGLGLVRSERVGVNRSVALPGLQSTATDLRLTTSLDTAPTGGGTYVSVIGRRVSATDDYRAKLRYQADGRVLVYLTRVVGGAETTLTSAVVNGAVAAADRPLEVRFQVTGTGPTALAVKVWPQGSPEPSTWTSRTTDATAVLQARGGIGALLYVSSTGAPVTARFDDVTATDVP